MTGTTNESATEMLARLETMATDDGETWDLSVNDQAAIAWAIGELAAYRELRDWAEANHWLDRALRRCSCEVDRHDFNCPVHNDVDHPKRGPNGDE